MSISRLALFAVIPLCASCAMFKPGPGKTVKEFVSAVEGGRVQEAVLLISTDTRTRVGDAKLRSGLAKTSREVQAITDKGEIEITDEQVHGDLADVAYTEKFADGRVAKADTMHLVKENGDWKIVATGGK